MPRRKQVYIVGGFAFTSENEAEQAKKEQEGIKFVRQKTDMNDPEKVLQIYNKMVDEELFVTLVGYAYLRDLQEYLTTIPFIRNEDIHPITVIHPTLAESLREEKQKHQAKMQKVKKEASKQLNESEVRKKYKVSLLLNLILVISVVFMFFISGTSGHPTILNYEEELVNRYSAWEQELSEREAALREAENQ